MVENKQEERMSAACGQSWLLALTTSRPEHAARSGYSRLLEYMPGCEVLTAERKPPHGPLRRVGRFLLSRGAVTSWYQLASASLEWQAWQRIRNGFRGVLHVLWADSDLGILDLLVTQKRQSLCCTFHASPDELRQLIRYPERLSRIPRVVLMSSSQVQYFLDIGFPEERISVIHHGVDTVYFRPKARLESEKFVVLCVGSYRRNLPLLQEVCQRLRGQPGVEFEIVIGRSFHQMFDQLPNATCRANLSDAELLEAYQSASCYLVTAEEATANNALLESMACGLPIVAEGVGGIPEYAGCAGSFITAPRNAQQIVEAIIALKESSALRQRMAEGSRRRALELDWARIADLTREVYLRTAPIELHNE